MWSATPNYANGVPWMDLRTALADRFTVIAMDQRNAGKSVADVKPDHGWHTFAADHLALIDHLGFKKFHVMGRIASLRQYCRTRSTCTRTAIPGMPR